MRTLRLALVLGTLVLGTALTTTTAHADDEQGTTRYDFEDELVRGDLVRPDGEILRVRSRSGRRTLIRVRESFVAELYKAVGHL